MRQNGNQRAQQLRHNIQTVIRMFVHFSFPNLYISQEHMAITKPFFSSLFSQTQIQSFTRFPLQSYSNTYRASQQHGQTPQGKSQSNEHQPPGSSFSALRLKHTTTKSRNRTNSTRAKGVFCVCRGLIFLCINDGRILMAFSGYVSVCCPSGRLKSCVIRNQFVLSPRNKYN